MLSGVLYNIFQKGVPNIVPPSFDVKNHFSNKRAALPPAIPIGKWMNVNASQMNQCGKIENFFD